MALSRRLGPAEQLVLGLASVVKTSRAKDISLLLSACSPFKAQQRHTTECKQATAVIAVVAAVMSCKPQRESTQLVPP